MTDGIPAGSPLAIGVDVGGTKVVAGLVDAAGALVGHARRDTPGRTTQPSVVEDVIVEVVTEIRTLAAREHADRPLLGVGLGAAGFISADQRTVVFAPHLSWRDEPIRDRLAERLSLPVVLDNDANAAAWAEHRFGAGREESRLLLVTLGTGIGGALVINGQLERGRHGLAGEFGHMQVVPDGERCECGNRGCWEQYSSGHAMQREAREMLEQDSPYAAGLAGYCGGDPARVEGHHVTQAARDGDVAALELMGDVGRWLGVGLANLVAALDPGTIVVGGGVSEAGDLLLEPAREVFARRVTGRGHRPLPPIRAAALGPAAGMIGAADLLRAALDDAAPGDAALDDEALDDEAPVGHAG